METAKWWERFQFADEAERGNDAWRMRILAQNANAAAASLRALIGRIRAGRIRIARRRKSRFHPMSFSPSTLPSFRSQAFIALGSNLNNPAWQLHSAFRGNRRYSDVSLVKISSLYRTAPVGIVDQPPFINAVAIVTTLSPHTLVAPFAPGIEESHGRVRGERNGPRTLVGLADVQRLADRRRAPDHAAPAHARPRIRAGAAGRNCTGPKSLALAAQRSPPARCKRRGAPG